MKSSTPQAMLRKPYTEMNASELAEATKEFDTEFVADTFRPLTPAERAQWNRIKKKMPGRPKVGEGAQVVSVSIERTLLRSADRLARKRKITRASLIAEGLRAVLKQKAAAPKRRAPAKATKPKPRARKAA